MSSYVRQARHCRITGTIVEVLDLTHRNAEFEVEQGPDGPLRWMTVCQDHGFICSHQTLADARSHAVDPTGWCEECAELIEQRKAS